MPPQFGDALASLLLRGHDQDAVVCAVVDGQCYSAVDAAAQIDVPVLALRTDSAATFRTMLAFPRLRDAGYLPSKARSSSGSLWILLLEWTFPD
jgi:hypothetical protein